MISILPVNRRTTARCLAILTSAITSGLILTGGQAQAQEKVNPPVPMPSEVKPSAVPQVQPPTPEQRRQLEQEYDEGKFTPPGREELYRVDSEATKFERVRQWRKALGRMDIDFPDEDSIRVKGSLEKRKFEPMQTRMVASYVVYQPLYFEQLNTERYGWELGVFQPLVGTAQFYGDVLLFPYKFASHPSWHCESNVGYGLPGDPEPLRFLTPSFSWRGVAATAGVAVGGAAIFP